MAGRFPYPPHRLQPRRYDSYRPNYSQRVHSQSEDSEDQGRHFMPNMHTYRTRLSTEQALEIREEKLDEREKALLKREKIIELGEIRLKEEVKKLEEEVKMLEEEARRFHGKQYLSNEASKTVTPSRRHSTRHMDEFAASTRCDNTDGNGYKIVRVIDNGCLILQRVSWITLLVTTISVGFAVGFGPVLFTFMVCLLGVFILA